MFPAIGVKNKGLYEIKLASTPIINAWGGYGDGAQGIRVNADGGSFLFIVA